MHSKVDKIVDAFIAEDILDILLGGIVEADISGMVNDDNIDSIRNIAIFREKSGASYTIRDIDTKRILVCCGVDILWPGVGELWALFAKDNTRPIETVRKMQWCLNDLQEKFNFHRIHSFVREDLKQARKMNEFLGLVPESIAYKFTHDKKNSIVYTIVR
jgi:hypothetical protein